MARPVKGEVLIEREEALIHLIASKTLANDQVNMYVSMYLLGLAFLFIHRYKRKNNIMSTDVSETGVYKQRMEAAHRGL